MNIKQIKKRAKTGTMRGQGGYFTTYEHLAAPGTTLKDVMNYQYWVDEAHMFDVFNKIEVITEDGDFRAVLLVESAEKQVGAKVALLEYQKIEELERDGDTAPDMATGYSVQWKGGAKWCVVRESDGVYISRDNSSKSEAEFALKNHLTAIAA